VTERRRISFLRVLPILWLLTSSQAGRGEDLGGPSWRDWVITFSLSLRVNENHLSQCKLGDVISRRTLEGFFLALDPEYSMFTEEDFEEFSQKYGDRLDDLLRRGDAHFAFELYRRFLERADERRLWVTDLVQVNYDLDEPTTVILTPTRFPQNANSAKKLWERWIKYRLTVLDLDGMTELEARRKVQDHFESQYKQWKAMDAPSLVALYLDTAMKSFCPHTRYFPPAAYEELSSTVEGKDGAPKVSSSSYRVTGALTRQKFSIGVIDIPGFYRGKEGATAKDVKAALLKFKAKKIQGVIVDIRGNGGGLKQEMVDTAGLFVGQAAVVQVPNGEGHLVPVRSEETALLDVPVLVAVDRNTVSAAEGFAQALKDHEVALIVGDKFTYGKGTIQKLTPLFSEPFQSFLRAGALKVTVEPLYSPKGYALQAKGVEADVWHPSALDVLGEGEAARKHALTLADVRAGEGDAPPAGTKLNREIVKGLVLLHQTRMKENESLKKMEGARSRWVQLKERKELTFTRTTLREELLAAQSIQELLTKAGALGKNPNQDFASTVYNVEFFKVLADWLEMLR
jgi:C-terminal processing protease CtpA/Prc